MAGPCLGDGAQVLLAERLESLGEPIALPYKSPPKKITDLFDDEKGPDAWTKAFNAAFEQYDGDEGKANATAWAAIEKMGYKKGEDGKYRKSKTAATAANQGGRMSFKEKAIAALKDVAARLEGEPEEGAVLAPPAPVVAAAPPVGEPARDPEVKALAAEVGELKKALVSQKIEFTAATLLAESKELCLAAKAEPRFEKPIAQLLALIPPEAEVVLTEADDPAKVVKAPAREWFKNVLLAKGTAKLEDPAALTKPPKKALVKPIAASDNKSMPEDEDTQVALTAAARNRAREKGISINVAQAEVLAEWRKEQEV